MKTTDKKSDRRQWRPPEPDRVLLFSPLAWLKLLFCLHAGDTEVAGFGISSLAQPLYVRDFLLVAQNAGPASFKFDKNALADFYDRMADAGRLPAEFFCIMIHTHPGESPQPSLTDEEVFDREFGDNAWAVMAIVSRTQQTYARLGLSPGPRGQVQLDVAVDWAAWPQAVLEDPQQWPKRLEEWKTEYEQNVHPEKFGRVLQMFMEEPQEFWEPDEYELWAREWSVPGFLPEPTAEGQVTS